MPLILAHRPRITYPPPTEYPLPEDGPLMSILRIPTKERTWGGVFVPSEDDALRGLAKYLDAAGFLWCHNPNEAYLAERGKAMNVLKSKGLKVGFPDIAIFRPFMIEAAHYNGLAIELKRADATPCAVIGEQRWWLSHLRDCGWMAEWCRGEAEALRLVRACYGH